MLNKKNIYEKLYLLKYFAVEKAVVSVPVIIRIVVSKLWYTLFSTLWVFLQFHILKPMDRKEIVLNTVVLKKFYIDFSLSMKLTLWFSY